MKLKVSVTLTTAHLLAALSQPWSSSTCLVAQGISEAIGEPLINCGVGILRLRDGISIKWRSEEADEVQRHFDALHDDRATETEAAKALRDARLIQLTAKLPITFDIEVTVPPKVQPELFSEIHAPSLV